jgi:hypothetical protein
LNNQNDENNVLKTYDNQKLEDLKKIINDYKTLGEANSDDINELDDSQKT